MKTSARSIAQTTKYRTPSVWNPLAAVRHREESWFYFPEPSMVFKKEEEGEEQDNQMFSLLFQLLNYDFSSKNQYFLKLEMQPLLQDLKVMIAHGAREEKTILEKMHQMLQEILRLKEVRKNSTIWLNYVESLKQEANVLLEQLVQKQSVQHSSVHMFQNAVYQLRNWDIQPLTQIQTNVSQKITAYENRLHKPLDSFQKPLFSEHWKNDVHLLHTIYESMSMEEKESFLQEISVTETEFLSVQNMTREQWEMFLTKTLPLISSYVTKQEENKRLVETKDVLTFMMNLTEVQWKQLKMTLTQNVHAEYETLHSYFNKVENQTQDTSYENWMQGKQDFVSYIKNNQYTSLFKTFLSSTDILNDEVLLKEREKVLEMHDTPAVKETTEKLTNWIFQITKNQQQAIKNIFEVPEENYGVPHLDSVQIKPSEKQQILTEEIQKIQKYIQNNNIPAVESVEQKTQNRFASENQMITHRQQITSNMLSMGHWRQDIQQFYQMYRSMETAEKETFLHELSLTETELVSVQEMTQKQWEVFLTNTLPLITTFVKKQKSMLETKEKLNEKDVLRQLEVFVETQQQKSDFTWTQNQYTNLRNLRTLFNFERQEVNSIFRNEKKNAFTLSQYGRKLEEILLEPMGLRLKNGSILENRQIYRFGKTIDTLTTSNWKQNVKQFANVYQSMEKEEKESFLQELSMTDLEIRSIQTMSKGQWEVFLTNTMPLVSSFIEKQEELQATKQTIHQKELLHQLKELKNIQEQNLKLISMQQEQYNTRDFRSFSMTTNVASSNLFQKHRSENHQISLLQKVSGTVATERWQRELRAFYHIYESMGIEEKNHFLAELSMTETEMLSVRKMTKEQWEVFLTNTKPLIASYVKEQEEIQKIQNKKQESELLRYVKELTETQWQDLKSLLLSEEDIHVQNLRSYFKETQQENLLSVENWIQEKQAFVDYVQNHQYITLLRSALTAIENKKQEKIFFQGKEEKTYSESVLHETTERLGEWISYLTENQWQEIKNILVENNENVFIKPILEVMEQHKSANAEPVFSAEKRGLISYLTEHTDSSVKIIHLLQSKESLKNSMEDWITLPMEEKTEGTDVIDQENLYTFTDEQIQNTSDSLTEWLSYLTENQWQEVKSVLTIHQNEAYILPLLEMVRHQKPFEMEPVFSAEKRGAMTFINQNKHASTELVKILIHQKEIEKNLSEWIDLTPWKKAQESAHKTWTEIPVSMEETTTNSIHLLTKFISVLTESQWKELRETAATHQQYPHLQPILTLSKTQETYHSFEEEKKIWIDHITENQSATAEFLNLVQENQKVNMIFQNLQQKAGAASHSVQEKSSSTQISLQIPEEKRMVENIILQRMTHWLQQTIAKQESSPVQKLKTDEIGQNMPMEHQTVFHHSMSILQKRNPSERNIAAANQTSNLQNSIVNNGSLLQTIHHFSGVMNQDIPENALLQPDSYGIAQMVVVKKNQGNAMVQTPPKIPEVVLEAKKAMQAEVHDIITKKRSQNEEQADNKTVLELMRRLDVQQKEIEKIRSTQKQMLNITDISIVTEKIMNQMQSQLRLEKMRRGL